MAFRRKKKKNSWKALEENQANTKSGLETNKISASAVTTHLISQGHDDIAKVTEALIYVLCFN